MPETLVTYDDGSEIIWVDRETVRYSNAGFEVLVWVDYEGGFRGRGRVIHLESISNWNITPQGAHATISIVERQKVVDAVTRYFGKAHVRCVEMG